MDDSILPHHGWCGLGTLEVLCVLNAVRPRGRCMVYMEQKMRRCNANFVDVVDVKIM